MEEILAYKAVLIALFCLSGLISTNFAVNFGITIDIQSISYTTGKNEPIFSYSYMSNLWHIKENLQKKQMTPEETNDWRNGIIKLCMYNMKAYAIDFWQRVENL